MKIFLILFFILAFILIVSGQNTKFENKSKVVNKQTTEFPNESYSSRPKLTMQDAMKVMEKYIEKEKIDTSKYYLWEVKLIQYGSENEKRPAWHFWWLSEKGGVGDYIEILVFMDKKAGRTPSM